MARKSLRGSAVGKGRGASSSSEALADEDEEGRWKAALPPCLVGDCMPRPAIVCGNEAIVERSGERGYRVQDSIAVERQVVA